eukprot:GHUV01024259.1.p1 GENE.GHUV01024259.1~~GHUV01024259.1.p1  ORF type:complete len:106 (-),score=23.19 GHUV01024259.1:428-745(-)
MQTCTADGLLHGKSLCVHCRQFRLLLRRSWRQITRDRAAAIARLSSNVSSAVIFGAIFFRMQKKQSSIQDRLGLLQVGNHVIMFAASRNLPNRFCCLAYLWYCCM